MATRPSLSAQQFEAAFCEAANGVAPAEVKVVPLGKQLAPYRRVLLKYRAQGYTPQQLATFLKHPKIGINASASFVRKFLLVRHREPLHFTIKPEFLAQMAKEDAERLRTGQTQP